MWSSARTSRINVQFRHPTPRVFVVLLSSFLLLLRPQSLGTDAQTDATTRLTSRDQAFCSLLLLRLVSVAS